MATRPGRLRQEAPRFPVCIGRRCSLDRVMTERSGGAGTADVPLVHLQHVVKNYQSLRPLRVRDLTLRRGHAVALLGFDAPMAEVLVNLITAGSLPDEGRVLVFGEPTSTITDHAAWMRMLDRFG